MNILSCPKCGKEPIKILFDKKMQRSCCRATFESDKEWNAYCIAMEFTTTSIEYNIIEKLYRQIWKENNSNAKSEIEKCYHEILKLKDISEDKIKRRYYTNI